MPMLPDGFNEDGSFRFRYCGEDLSAVPDPSFRPYPITIEDIQKHFMFLPPLGEQLCCASNEATNTTDKDKIKKIKDLVKKCVNLNVYIDGENVFQKILKICEGKDE